MRYVLLIGSDKSAGASSRDVCRGPEARAWVDEMERRGVLVGGELLQPASVATTVRMRDGEVLVSDGPFAETKEQMGGFNLIECVDLDEAIEVASKHPVARFGSIEVRPVWEP